MVQMEIKVHTWFFLFLQTFSPYCPNISVSLLFCEMHFLEIVLWEFGPQSEVFYIFVIFVVDSILFLRINNLLAACERYKTCTTVNFWTLSIQQTAQNYLKFWYLPWNWMIVWNFILGVTLLWALLTENFSDLCVVQKHFF